MSNELGSYDLIVSLLCGLFLPLIVVLNLRERTAPSTPMSAYLWGREPTLSLVGLAFLSVLALFAWGELAVHFGVVAANLRDHLALVLGVPMAILAFAVLILATRAVYRSLRRAPTAR
ncbi:MAG: hypothetical protein NW217_15510 [Hyphomicrobiaceae bacterium]|nr:hypothetical protein [Hyphomicrobiaceae bacterium]